MKYVGFIAVALVLSMIAYQDFRLRAVSWPLFPFLAVLLILCTYLQYPALIPATYLLQTAFKAGFVSLQLLLLRVYYILRFPPGQRKLSTRLGLGDILFLYAILFYFSPLNFFLFYIGSLALAIPAGLMIQKTGRREKTKTVPLAGLQSFFFLIFIIANMFMALNPFDDTWLLNLLQPYDRIALFYYPCGAGIC